MDTQTQPKPTKPPSALSGFNLPIPLSEIIPAPGTHPDAQLRIAEVRRQVGDRYFTIQKMVGRRERHLAEIAECRDALQNRKDLKPWQEKDLRGRILEAQARADWCAEKADLYVQEIRAWMAKLVGENSDGVY